MMVQEALALKPQHQTIRLLSLVVPVPAADGTVWGDHHRQLGVVQERADPHRTGFWRPAAGTPPAMMAVACPAEELDRVGFRHIKTASAK